MYRKGLTLGVLAKQCELIEELLSKMEGAVKINPDERGAYSYKMNQIISNLKEIRKIQKNYQRYGKQNRVFFADPNEITPYLID